MKIAKVLSKCNSCIRPLVAGIAIATLSQAAFASEPSSGHGNGHHDFDRHMIGFFVGGDHDKGEDELSYGIEYEYRFTRMIGAGVIYEEVPDAHHGDGASLYMAALSVHPYAGWRLLAAAGEVKVHGSHGHTENLYRVGAGYDFHIGNFGIEPTISVDKADGNYKTVYGVLFNYKF